MCQRVTCKQCGKPTYAGCGAHVEQVLAGVAREKRCRCREANAETPPTQSKAEPRSWLRELLRK